MKKKLSKLTKEEFEKLKSTGMLWEIYPDAPDTFERIHNNLFENEENLLGGW